MEGTRATDGTSAGFVHTAVCHRTTDELVDAVLPFVEEGLARTEPVWVNLAADRLVALQSALGRSAAPQGSRPYSLSAANSSDSSLSIHASRHGEGVHWTDTHQWCPHPARRLRAIGDLVRKEQQRHSRPLRFVGECAWPEGPGALVAEWERFDAVLNDALAASPLTMVCTYDAASLPPEVIERVQASHPKLGVADPVTSSGYVHPDQFCAHAGQPLLPMPATARHAGPMVTPAASRVLLREVARAAERDGAPIEQTVVEDLSTCITEIVANSWRAGAGRIEAWCWQRGGEVGARVVDDGPGWSDPLAGYRRPHLDDENGRGLWVTRQLADVLQIRSDTSGTAAQVLMLDRAPAVT